MNTFANYALGRGGIVYPLLIPAKHTDGLGILNPSIYNDNGRLIVNLRQVNYTLYHSEKKIFKHAHGSLAYIHPENDLHLRTWNWYCELDDSFNIVKHNKIDTSKFDNYKTKGEFIGLEDARVVRWNSKLYISGVRRDTTRNGNGRMELSQLCVNDNSVIEVSRIRIPNPGNTSSYCEKNWMPVLDLPYHYIKWSDPVELIYVDINCVSSKLLFKGSLSTIPITQRGGSQVLKTLNGWLAITHEVKLFTNKNNCKDAIYHHRFILWDENWKIKKYSKPFSIMGSSIEFVAGMCIYKDKLLISYGFQDNAAYILSTNLQTIMDFMDE